MSTAYTLIVDPVAGRIDRVLASGKIRTNIGNICSKGYVRIGQNKRPLLAHRIIYAHFHGPISPDMQVDHINGIKTDNRIENLRSVTLQENLWNTRKAKKSNKSSGLLGVSWSKTRGKWAAQIRIDGKPTMLGYFDDKELAHQEYLKAKRKHHSTCEI